MKTLRFHLSISLLFSFSFLHATDISISETTIKKVRLFFQGAEIKRQVTTKFNTGKNTIIISGVSSSADKSSVNIDAIADARILSSYLEKGEGDKNLAGELKTSKIILNDLQASVKLTTMQIEALNEELESLLKNSVRIGNSSGINLTDLDKTLAYMRKKQEEILQLILKKEKEKQEKETQTANAKTRLEELIRKQEAAYYNLIITAESSTDHESTLNFSYYVANCGWLPFYNIFCNGNGEKLDIEYKAQVQNNSGEDWTKIPLTLIPGNPSAGLTAPQLETWVLAYSQRTRSKKVRTFNSSGNEGQFSKQQIKDGKNSVETTAQMQEIEIEEGNIAFEIAEKLSISSSNLPVQVDISRFTKDALYYYKAIPKIERKAYLISMLTDWEDMQLIEGEANVFMNTIYSGRTYVDPVSAGDTLEISLGPDPAIQITRVKKKDQTRKRLIGLQLTEVFSYEIDIRNLNKKNVKIEVADQIPLAQQSDITINAEEINGGDLTPENGKITWTLDIPPANTVKLKLGYSVRYPRDKMVVIKRTAKVYCPRFY